MIADDPSQWRRDDHEPSERSRMLVEKLAMLRVPHADIARKIGVDLAALVEHLRRRVGAGRG
jgi:hypothetical protein